MKEKNNIKNGIIAYGLLCSILLKGECIMNKAIKNQLELARELEKVAKGLRESSNDGMVYGIPDMETWFSIVKMSFNSMMSNLPNIVGPVGKRRELKKLNLWELITNYKRQQEKEGLPFGDKYEICKHMMENEKYAPKGTGTEPVLVIDDESKEWTLEIKSAY